MAPAATIVQMEWILELQLYFFQAGLLYTMLLLSISTGAFIVFYKSNSLLDAEFVESQNVVTQVLACHAAFEFNACFLSQSLNSQQNKPIFFKRR